MNKKNSLIKLQETEIKHLNEVITDLREQMANIKVKVVLFPVGSSLISQDLANCHCYVLELPEKQDFPFEDIEVDIPENKENNFQRYPMKFDHIMIFTPREFTDEFKFSNISVEIMEGFQEIELPGTHAWVQRIFDLPDNTPAFIVNYTERDTERFADLVINATQIKDLYIKTLERMYVYMRDQFSRFKNELNNALFLADQEEYTKEQLVNKIRDKLYLVDNKFKDQVAKAKGNEFKIKIWQAAILGVGWIVAFILAFFVGR